MSPMRSPPPMYGDVYELRVALLSIEPSVWRGLSVPADIRLDVLHEVLQAAFGWKNCHLHDFRAGDIRWRPAGALAVNKKLATLAKRVECWRR